MVFFFFLFVAILASVFSYNEILKGNVIITSSNPPVQVRSKITGKISQINFKSGELVSEGSILAVLQNQVDDKDVAFLKYRLTNSSSEIQSLEVLNKEFPYHLKLGTSIQPFYNVYLGNYQKLILDRSVQEGFILELQLKDQLFNQEKSLDKKKEELLLADQVLKIRETNFHRYQILHSKGVVSQSELEKTEMEFLDKKKELHFIEHQLNQLSLDKRHTGNNLTLNRNANLKNLSVQERDLILSRQDLLNAIYAWEEDYLLKSPIGGRLSYNEIWNRFQDVETGDIVFSVMPTERQKFIGKCKIPARNSGKVQQGQKVFVKLENFPYQEWGMVIAKVHSVSKVSLGVQDQTYVVYLDVENLKTSYGKELNYNQELTGSAEIILDEVTLMERVFYQFRHLWSVNL